MQKQIKIRAMTKDEFIKKWENKKQTILKTSVTFEKHPDLDAFLANSNANIIFEMLTDFKSIIDTTTVITSERNEDTYLKGYRDGQEQALKIAEALLNLKS